jgi:hypothetical protein
MFDHCFGIALADCRLDAISRVVHGEGEVCDIEVIDVKTAKAHEFLVTGKAARGQDHSFAVELQGFASGVGGVAANDLTSIIGNQRLERGFAHKFSTIFQGSLIQLWQHLTTLSLATLAGCQETPETAIVIKKDTEQLIETASGDDSSKKVSAVAFPQRLFTSFESAWGLNIIERAPSAGSTRTLFVRSGSELTQPGAGGNPDASYAQKGALLACSDTREGKDRGGYPYMRRVLGENEAPGETNGAYEY